VGRREVAGRPLTAARGVAAGAVLACCVALIGWLARPRAYEVAGVSMAPGLLPGDLVVTGAWPLLDAWRPPRRLDRWVVAAPDGELAIKRIVGLPGETVALVAGDLVIDGRPRPPSPGELAGRATAVTCGALAGADAAVDVITGGMDGTDGNAGAVTASDRRWRRRFPATDLLDDAAFAPRERRLLLPVRDFGLAAVVRVEPGGPPLDVRIGVGQVAIRWRLRSPGRHAFAAGLLDGHVVGASWPLPGRPDPAAADGSSPLPPLPPAVWDVVLPGGVAAAPLELLVEPGGLAPGAPRGLARGFTHAFKVERLGGWRDAVYRPAADGGTEWTLGADEYLLFGDHATGSRDSRHFGPVGRASLLHRVTPAGRPAGG
jgi:hypothetical protein